MTVFGRRNDNRVLASDCPVQTLETVNCEPLGTENFNAYGIALKSNPVESNIELIVAIPYQLSYTMYNTEGRMISQGKVFKQSIPVSDAPPGLYFLQLTEENGLNVFSKKIAIK